MNASTEELGWEDVRTYLAVARGGSLTAAAQALKVHHSTVFRRIERLEANVGAALFERQGRQHTPTAAGEALQRRAQRVEEEMVAVQRSGLGSELLPAGTLRLTTLDTLLPYVVPALETLQGQCPDLRIELDATDRTRALDRRDADMALRPSESPPADAVGRRVAPLAWAAYARVRRSPKQLSVLRYVGPLAGMQAPHAVTQALGGGGGDSGRLRARTVAAMAQALESGLGRGALPCYVGDRNPRLRRLGMPVTPDGSALWLLRHPDLRDSARIKAVVERLLPALQPHIPLFKGERAGPARQRRA